MSRPLHKAVYDKPTKGSPKHRSFALVPGVLVSNLGGSSVDGGSAQCRRSNPLPRVSCSTAVATLPNSLESPGRQRRLTRVLSCLSPSAVRCIVFAVSVVSSTTVPPIFASSTIRIICRCPPSAISVCPVRSAVDVFVHGIVFVPSPSAPCGRMRHLFDDSWAHALLTSGAWI